VVDTTFPYRSSYFTNLQSESATLPQNPITYSNNQPSIYAVQTTAPTPSYLTSWEFWRLYTACSCVLAAAQETVTTTVYDQVSYLRPVGSATIYSSISRLTAPVRPRRPRLPSRLQGPMFSRTLLHIPPMVHSATPPSSSGACSKPSPCTVLSKPSRPYQPP
jgi:hypothetical protein